MVWPLKTLNNFAAYGHVVWALIFLERAAHLEFDPGLVPYFRGD